MPDQTAEIIRLLRTPASPLDIPGERLDVGITRRFGAASMDQMIRSGLLQRGGLPCPVPEKVARLYQENMEEHARMEQRRLDRGETDFTYPLCILSLTKEGWDYAIPGPGHADGEIVKHELWADHAYPLTQVIIQLQGTRHTGLSDIVQLLDDVRLLLLEGRMSGSEHDDDFGYRFTVSESDSGSVFGTESTGRRV